MKPDTAKATPFQRELKDILKGLRGDIYSGIRLPRERLVENDLANAFSVSRMVVRQALNILEAEGLVTTEPYKGASVAEISLVRISENYQIHAMLGGTAAMLATPNLDAHDIDALEANLTQQRGLDIDNVQEWQKLNHEFHRMINLKCGNRRLIELIKENSQFTSYWFIVLSAPGRISLNIKDHQAAVKAFAKDQAEEARRIIESHIIQNGEHLMEFMRKNVPPGMWQEGK
jgi:DNA-binding GntR family transcriptional regulator